MLFRSYVDALPGSPSFTYPQSTDESTTEPSLSGWNYGGMPSASVPSSKALASYFPRSSSSYKSTSGSGIPSYFDNMHNGNSNDHQQQYSSGSTASFNGDSSSSEPKEPSTPASEPLRHGGMPSATTEIYTMSNTLSLHDALPICSVVDSSVDCG